MIGLTRFQSTTHTLQRMFGEELQHADESPRTCLEAVFVFELATKRGETRRQFPVPVHGSVVERSGLAAQSREIVNGVKDERALPVASCVGCNHMAGRRDHDAIDVTFDRHHLERERSRDAVSIAIKGHGLILVDSDRWANHAGIKLMVRKRRRRGLFFGETHADLERAEQSLDDPLAFGFATPAEQRIEAHRSRPRGALVWQTGVARP